MIDLTAQRLKELEVEGLTGTALGERDRPGTALGERDRPGTEPPHTQTRLKA